MKRCSLLLILFLSLTCNAQKILEPSDSLSKVRRSLVIGSSTSIYSASIIGLQFAWYQEFQSGGFRFFNDWNGWLQMDKAAHSVATYQISNNLYKINRWAGIQDKKALWWAFGTSYSFQLAVELMDGFAEGWGFSHPDLAFNTIGGGLFVGQQLGWKEQRIGLKYTFWPSKLDKAPGVDGERARYLYGTSVQEHMLKDYNAQTFWVSANIWSLVGKPEKFPKWLNLAVGYSTNGVLGAERNWWYDTENPETKIYSSRIRERQLLLSLDVDLSKTKMPRYLNWVKPIFGIVKIPFPTIELNSNKGLKGHLLYF